MALLQNKRRCFVKPLHEFSLERLKDFIKQHQIELVIPLSFSDMRFLSVQNIGCRYLSPPNFEMVRLLDQKNLFFDFMSYNGLSEFLPETYVVCADEPVRYGSIKYPAIFKPISGVGGFGVEILTDEKTDFFEGRKNYIVQAYIPAQKEYVGNYVFYQGELLFSQVLSETFNTDIHIKKGKMISYEAVDDFDHQRFSKIFSLLKFTGAICINFKMQGSAIKIFEINPRVGGTLVCNFLNEVTAAITSYFERRR